MLILTASGISYAATNVTIALNDTDVGNFVGSQNVNGVSVDTDEGGAYFAAGNGKWFYYNYSTNISHDLGQTDVGNFWSTQTVNAVSYDSKGIGAYIAGQQGKWGYYNKSTNITHDLRITKSSVRFNTIITINSIVTDDNSNAYFGRGDELYFYDKGKNYTENLTDTDIDDWLGLGTGITDLSYDRNCEKVWISSSSGRFGWYNRTTNSSINLSSTDVAGFFNSNINGIAADTINCGAYLVGAAGDFGYYNSSTNITHNLGSSSNGLVLGALQCLDIAFDNTTGGAYFGCSFGQYFFYNKSANVTVNLTDTDILNWIGTATTDDILDVSFSPRTNHTMYLGKETGGYGVYISRNITEVVEESPTDPCTCPAAGDFEINAGTFCNQTSGTCDVTPNRFRVNAGGGYHIEAGAKVRAKGCYIDGQARFFVHNSGGLACT